MAPDKVLLDRNQRVVLTLTAEGPPGTVTIGGRPGRLVSRTALTSPGSRRDVVVTAPPAIKVKDALEIRHKTVLVNIK